MRQPRCAAGRWKAAHEATTVVAGQNPAVALTRLLGRHGGTAVPSIAPLSWPSLHAGPHQPLSTERGTEAPEGTWLCPLQEDLLLGPGLASCLLSSCHPPESVHRNLSSVSSMEKSREAPHPRH